MGSHDGRAILLQTHRCAGCCIPSPATPANAAAHTAHNEPAQWWASTWRWVRACIRASLGSADKAKLHSLTSGTIFFRCVHVACILTLGDRLCGGTMAWTCCSSRAWLLLRCAWAATTAAVLLTLQCTAHSSFLRRAETSALATSKAKQEVYWKWEVDK
jgi:hypothetical protein